MWRLIETLVIKCQISTKRHFSSGNVSADLYSFCQNHQCILVRAICVIITQARVFLCRTYMLCYWNQSWFVWYTHVSRISNKNTVQTRNSYVPSFQQHLNTLHMYQMLLDVCNRNIITQGNFRFLTVTKNGENYSLVYSINLHVWESHSTFQSIYNANMILIIRHVWLVKIVYSRNKRYHLLHVGFFNTLLIVQTFGMNKIVKHIKWVG